MTNTPVVYVTNKASTHDYSSASKIGSLRFVTAGNYPIFKTTRLQEEIITALAFSKKEDYLLFSGSSVVAALCMATWLEMHGEAKILLWDRTEDSYVTRVIDRAKLRVDLESARDLAEGRAGWVVRRDTEVT